MSDRDDADGLADPDDADGLTDSDDAGGFTEPDAPASEEQAVGTGASDESVENGDATRTGAETVTTVDDALADELLGESRRLDPQVRYLWVVGPAVSAVVGATVVAVFVHYVASQAGYDVGGSLPFGFSQFTVLVGILTLLVFFGLSVLRAVLLYRSWRYEVREDSLYLTRGVLTRVQTVAPYVRVQHIDTRRSPFERLLGLSSLVIYTAGSRGADVTIPGLTDERADELQTRLKRLAIVSEEEDAV